MTDSFTPVMRALVVAALMAATAALMLVTVNTASRAAGALAIGACGAFGEAYDFHTVALARKECAGQVPGQ